MNLSLCEHAGTCRGPASPRATLMFPAGCAGCHSQVWAYMCPGTGCVWLVDQDMKIASHVAYCRKKHDVFACIMCIHSHSWEEAANF